MVFFAHKLFSKGASNFVAFQLGGPGLENLFS
jgi:hypothetical protein